MSFSALLILLVLREPFAFLVATILLVILLKWIWGKLMEQPPRVHNERHHPD